MLRYRLFQIVLCASLLAAYSPRLSAQDDPPDTERIVTGRPRLYFVKRAINPLTWVEVAAEPLFRSGDGGFLSKLGHKKPHLSQNTAGVRFGLNRSFQGSGYGPEITFFHKNVLGRGIEVEVPLLYTYSRYEKYAFTTRVPLASDTFVHRLTFDVGGVYDSRASENVFGLGRDSRLEQQSDVRVVTREALAGLSTYINDNWKSGFHVAYRNVGVTAPRSGLPAQERFSEVEIPGLFTGATLASAAISLDHDTRKKDHMRGEGGLEHFEVSLNEGIRKGDFSYWRYHFDFIRFFPLSSDRRTVIAFRGMAETNQEKGGSHVPFFDMPAIGGWDTVRGLDDFRFRDKSAISFGAEYRYRIWESMDWGFFLDEGQVAPEPGDFAFNRFHTGYGARLIFLPKPDYPVSVDLGRSREKWILSFNLHRSF
jgi:outer membrane protein assembly factor BamA